MKGAILDAVGRACARLGGPEVAGLGQHEREGGAPTQLALDVDAAALPLGERLGDVEAQARAFPAPLDALAAGEFLEDPLLVFGGDPRAAILDLESDLTGLGIDHA